jgi:hypothetical protein
MGTIQIMPTCESVSNECKFIDQLKDGIAEDLKEYESNDVIGIRGFSGEKAHTELGKRLLNWRYTQRAQKRAVAAASVDIPALEIQAVGNKVPKLTRTQARNSKRRMKRITV